MKRKKLSPKLKQKIKSDYASLKPSQFQGEALRYYQQVTSLAKARKVKAAMVVQVGSDTIRKGSEIYAIVEKAAEKKGVSVKQFIKDNKEEIIKLANKGSITVVKEADYVEREIDAMPRTAKVFINGKRVSKPKAKYILSSFKSNAITIASIYDVLNMEITFDLKGNLYLDIPLPEEYANIEDGEELLGLIDASYPHISYIRNTND